MEQVSLFRTIACNPFCTDKAREFRPVSLDEILSMLVRYEGPKDPSDSDLNDTDKSARTLLSHSKEKSVFLSDVDVSASENTRSGTTKPHA